MTNNITTLESDLYKQANYDDLTGARNLRKFKVDAQEKLHNNPNGKFIIVKIDIDDFKLINDVYGSVKADKILIKLSDVFKKYENLDNDIFGRITAD
jgi:diguanylate cyclase (GGDEF) domain